MEQKNLKNPRQGDLVFVKLEKYDTRLKHLNRDSTPGYRKDGIIQEGEATGHHHSVDPTKADVYRNWGMPIIVVGNEPTAVIHGGSTEVDDRFHGPNMLEANTAYEVHIAREEDPTGEIRQVVD